MRPQLDQETREIQAVGDRGLRQILVPTRRDPLEMRGLQRLGPCLSRESDFFLLRFSKKIAAFRKGGSESDLVVHPDTRKKLPKYHNGTRSPLAALDHKCRVRDVEDYLK